jgi:hypothetical protein
MSFEEIKETICHELRWNYNDIDVEITWRCQTSEYQYYLVLIVYDDSFKTMIDSFIQNGLNMMVLYVSSCPKSLCVLTSGRICISASQSVDSSKSVSKMKKKLLLDDCYKELMILYLTIYLLIYIDLTIMSLATIWWYVKPKYNSKCW